MANKPPHLSWDTWNRMQGTGSYTPTPYQAPERPDYVPEDIWNSTPQAYRSLLVNKFKQDAMTPRRPTGRVPAPVVPPDPRKPGGRVGGYGVDSPTVDPPLTGGGGGRPQDRQVDPKSMQSPLASALSQQPQAWHYAGMPDSTSHPQVPSNYYGGYQPPQQKQGGGKSGFDPQLEQAGGQFIGGLSGALQSGQPAYQPYSGVGQAQPQGGKNGF